MYATTTSSPDPGLREPSIDDHLEDHGRNFPADGEADADVEGHRRCACPDTEATEGDDTAGHASRFTG